MAIIRTIVSIPSQDAQYVLPNEWTAASVRQGYAEQLPYLANMVDSVSEATSPEGTVRTITFTQRTGNKG